MLSGRVSISLRLTLWFGGIFFLGWVLFGTAMWLNLKRTLTGERHLTLARRVDRLEELLRKDQKEDGAAGNQDFVDFAHATGNGLVEILNTDGTRAYTSPSLAARGFPWPAIRVDDSEQFVHIRSSGQWYWALVRPFALQGRPLFLLAAAPEAGNLTLLHEFWRGLLASAPLLLLVSSACGYWVSRRALRPVDQITTSARSISIRNLSERLPVTDAGDELQRLAETCNAMLDRLESAVQQIQQFTADASHELRGPLSFTRTVAEVALRNPQVDPESRRALEDIVEETAKASVLLEEMLTLARADADPFPIVFEPVNLTAVVREICILAHPLAQERGLTLIMPEETAPCMGVLGDSSSLRRLIWILVDNALKYTHSQGQIEISVDLIEDHATVRVRDNGMGISAVDLPNIFNRFYRADPSRAMVEGNGLGLAIAKWIADTHSAQFSVTSEERIGTVFQLTFLGRLAVGSSTGCVNAGRGPSTAPAWVFGKDVHRPRQLGHCLQQHTSFLHPESHQIS